jgi:hypothetical protein
MLRRCGGRGTGMAWALAFIIILGVGLPVAAWCYSRLRPPPPVSGLGTGYDRIDKWLLTQYQLAPLDRERVRKAVFQGRQLDHPALALAAHQLAAEVLRGKLGGLRLARVMGWVYLVTAVGFAALGIGGLVISHDPRYALAVVDSALFTVPAVLFARRLPGARGKVRLALEFNQNATRPLGDGAQGDGK